jgi:hypothetical protein
MAVSTKVMPVGVVSIRMPVALVQIMDGLIILASITRYCRAQWKSLMDFLNGESGKVGTSWIGVFPNTGRWPKKSIAFRSAELLCSSTAVPH